MIGVDPVHQPASLEQGAADVVANSPDRNSSMMRTFSSLMPALGAHISLEQLCQLEQGPPFLGVVDHRVDGNVVLGARDHLQLGAAARRSAPGTPG